MDTVSAIFLILFSYAILVIGVRIVFHRWLPPLSGLSAGIMKKEERKRNSYQECDEIGRLKKSKNVGAIVGYLSNPDDFVRWTAICALGDIKDTSAVEPLIAAVTNDPTNYNIIIESLKRIGGASIEPMCGLLQDTQRPAHIRKKLIQALGDLRDPIAIPILTTLSGDNDEALRKAAVRSLQKIKRL